MNVHLMFHEHDFVPERYPPSNAVTLMRDLELGELLQVMANGDDYIRQVAEHGLLVSLEHAEQIHYRQRVLQDCLTHRDLVRELYAIGSEATSLARSHAAPSLDGLAGKVRQSVEALKVFSTLLKDLRALADTERTEFASEGFRTFIAMLRCQLDDDLFADVDEHLRRLDPLNGMLFNVGLGAGNRGVGFTLEPSSRRTSWKSAIGRRADRALTFEIDPANDNAHQALIDFGDRGLAVVGRALAGAAESIGSFFRHLAAETGFYLGCLNLHDRLLELGAPICWPELATWDPPTLAYEGLYHAPLLVRDEQPVVGNAAHALGKTLVVITGANSGGKSTLLRALGVAQVMMQSGLFVAAHSFRASIGRGVFSHFIRREDTSMTSGKLDEELARMSALADRVSPRCFVLFNESFAATNEAEGSEIAHEIVSALLESDVRVFFVTHQYVLAQRLQREQGSSALFLRPERDARGDPTFKFAEGEPLPTSFGMDIYKRLGGWR